MSWSTAAMYSTTASLITFATLSSVSLSLLSLLV
jgi:hypothetical protein